MCVSTWKSRICRLESQNSPKLVWFESSFKKGSQYNCVFYLILEMCSASVFNEEEYWLFLKSMLLLIEMLNIYYISYTSYLYLLYY